MVILEVGIGINRGLKWMSLLIKYNNNIHVLNRELVKSIRHNILDFRYKIIMTTTTSHHRIIVNRIAGTRVGLNN